MDLNPEKTWTLKIWDPEKPDHEKRGKQLDAKKKQEDHIAQFISTEETL